MSTPASTTTSPAAGTATAVAHSNIALIKYWGKQDDALHLPATSSLSLTLDAHPTTTTVRVLDGPAGTAGSADEVMIGAAPATGGTRDRVVRFLDLVRALAGSDRAAAVTSVSTAPLGAGLASSAAGFAALAGAAAAAYGLTLSPRELSRLARRGSGSASRSVFGGLVVWHAGTDDLTSYAEPVEAPELDLAMVIVTLNAGHKAVSSRVAMRRTVDTSPFFAAWVQAAGADLADMLAALAAADLPRVGAITESNAMRMHATMLGAVPPVRYWEPASLAVLDRVRDLRAAGLGCWATMDAGPNVKVLCRGADLAAVAAGLADAVPTASLLPARPGPGLVVQPGAGVAR